MAAVLDVLYENGAPPADAVAADTMAAGQSLPGRDEPFGEAPRSPSLPQTFPPAEIGSVDLRPSRTAASSQGRHTRPGAASD